MRVREKPETFQTLIKCIYNFLIDRSTSHPLTHRICHQEILLTTQRMDCRDNLSIHQPSHATFGLSFVLFCVHLSVFYLFFHKKLIIPYMSFTQTSNKIVHADLMTHNSIQSQLNCLRGILIAPHMVFAVIQPGVWNILCWSSIAAVSNGL